MNVTASRTKTLVTVVLIMLSVLAAYSRPLLGRLSAANLPNPDSYYNMVTVLDGWGNHQFPLEARDNAPVGNWVHWTRPYAWTLWQAHRPFALAGFDEKQALLYGGAALTLGSMILLVLFVAAAVMNIAGRQAALVSGLMLATNNALLSYGRIDQVTHHIFMLVPVAAGAACLLNPRGEKLAALAGGCLLGLAWWISPEMMPLIVGLLYLRIARQIQNPLSGSLWPIAIGLAWMTLCAWSFDQPPPTFSTWALDRISLAYVLLAFLLAGILCLAEWLTSRPFRLSFVVGGVGLASVIAAGIWLRAVPQMLTNPADLIPPELKSLWWSHINELRSVQSFSDGVSCLVLPLCGAGLAGYAAWRNRSLWLGVLAMMSLAYGVLGAWHVRMAAAAAVAGVLALCAGAASLRILTDDETRPSSAQMAGGFLLAALGPLLLLVHAGLTTLWPQPTEEFHCGLGSVAGVLDEIPQATFLTSLASGPELLYRTHHRTVAAPYHHDVAGVLDSFHAWLDPDGASAENIVRRRAVGYVLGCTYFQAELHGKPGRRTLADRIGSGDAPDWLKAIPWPAGTQTNWHLYQVLPVRK